MIEAKPPLPLLLHDVDRNMSTLKENVPIREGNSGTFS
jgi:hypothetical protein